MRDVEVNLNYSVQKKKKHIKIANVSEILKNNLPIGLTLIRDAFACWDRDFNDTQHGTLHSCLYWQGIE